MDYIHVDHIKIVAAGGDLDAAPEIRITDQVLNLQTSPAIVERRTSQFPQPTERIEIGTNFTVSGQMENATLDQLVQMVGGSHAGNIYTKTQGIRSLPKYDLRIAVYRASDGVTVPWDLTNMQFITDVQLAMQQGQITYLPFEAQGTHETSLTIDNSVS